jgi:hypothetical protein
VKPVRAVVLPALLLLTGCATGLPAGAGLAHRDAYEPMVRSARVAEVPPETAEPAASPLVIAPGARPLAVQTAQALVGKSAIVLKGKRWGDDCTGLVRAVYAQVGVDLLSAAKPDDNGVTAIWRFATRFGHTYDGGHPVPGDLVFFKDTYDRNRDGRDNDGLTHVGLVETVGEDGTVVVIHRVAKGVVRYRMNLALRDQEKGPDGKPVNDWLRMPGPGTKPQLTSQLFGGYATVLPLEPRLASR